MDGSGANWLRRGAVIAGVVVTLACAATLTACGGSGGASSSPTPTVKVCTEAASGTTVSAKVGDRIMVKLKENPTTGYKWDMKFGPGLKLVIGTFFGPSFSPSPPIMGAGGTHTWLVQIDKPGTLTLTGIYARPWESASKGAASFSLTIDAK